MTRINNIKKKKNTIMPVESGGIKCAQPYNSKHHDITWAIKAIVNLDVTFSLCNALNAFNTVKKHLGDSLLELNVGQPNVGIMRK